MNLHNKGVRRLNPYLAQPQKSRSKSRINPEFIHWYPPAQMSMFMMIWVFILCMLSGFTDLDTYLVMLPIDPDWLTQIRICMGIIVTFLPVATGILSILTWWGEQNPKILSPVETTIIGFLLMVIGLIGLPGTCAANRSENNYSAIQILKKIRNAQETYFKTHLTYATTVEQLIQSSGIPGGLTEVEIRIGTVGYQGYRIVLFRTCPNCLPTGYEIQVAPTIRTGWLRSGNDAYFLDQTGNIHHSGGSTELADVNSDLFFY